MTPPQLFSLSCLGAFLVWQPSAFSQMLVPVIGGQATGSGSGFESIPGFFDAPPAAEPVAGPTSDDFGAAGTFFANSGRGFYLDFGVDFASVRISEVYVGLKSFGTDSSGVNVTYFWSTDTDVNYDALSGDTPAADFNLFTFTAASSAKSWQQIYAGPDVIPQARFYIGRFGGADAVSNRLEEIVLVSNIPEPGTSILLLGTLAGLGAATRRRRAA